MNEHYPFELPPLPWGYDALEPELDKQVLLFHHDKHFQTYVDNLNKLLENFPNYQKWSLSKLCQDWSELPDKIRQGVRNNAGGVYNHALYFQNLHPVPVSAPVPPLDGAVSRCFGSRAKCKEAFREAALGIFGSGWAWLCVTPDDDLTIAATANQDTPLPLVPLLCCDMWEHAYYLQYQNRRADYFNAWWNLIDWLRISKEYEVAIAQRLPYAK